MTIFRYRARHLLARYWALLLVPPSRMPCARARRTAPKLSKLLTSLLRVPPSISRQLIRTCSMRSRRMSHHPLPYQRARSRMRAKSSMYMVTTQFEPLRRRLRITGSPSISTLHSRQSSAEVNTHPQSPSRHQRAECPPHARIHIPKV